MNVFELEAPTTVRLADVVVLSDKDRAPDTNPGVGLDFSMTVSNDTLSMFDGSLRSTLYTKAASSSKPQQDTLVGIAPVSDTPNLTEIGKKLGQFGWDLELTGYTLVCDQGLGGKNSNIELEDGKLTNWRFKPKEGGSVEVKFRAEFPDVSEKTHGKLALLKTREFPITLAAPEVVQEDIEQAAAPDKATPRGAKAKGPELDTTAAWPFPIAGNAADTGAAAKTKTA